MNELLSFFHDGSLLDIRQKDDRIEFFLESAEIKKGDLPPYEGRVFAKVVINGVKSVKVNETAFSGVLDFEYDGGEIKDLVIKGDLIELGVEWTNYRPKLDVNEYSLIQVAGDSVRFEIFTPEKDVKWRYN